MDLHAMSGSRRAISPSWLSGSWRSLLYSSSGYSCHLFLIYSAASTWVSNSFFQNPWQHQHENESCSVTSDSLWPEDYTVHEILQSRILEWGAFPFSRGLPNPGIEPGSPALQVDSLPTELSGKPCIKKQIIKCIYYYHSSLTQQNYKKNFSRQEVSN